MPTMTEITKIAADYAKSRDALNQEILVLDKETRAIIARRRDRIARLSGQCKSHKTELEGMVARSAELFAKPKTRTVHGIKLGFRKGTGKLSWIDEQAVVEAIRVRFEEDQWPVYLKTSVAPIKPALNSLPALEIRKLGISISDAHDAVLVQPVKGDAEALAEALLADPKEARKGKRK